MVQFRPTAREIVAKIVYYGPPLSGKTTNLKLLWAGYPEEVRGELIVLPTGTDRTIFFDYLPLTFRKLRGMDLKIQLYTVPGQVRFDSTRQIVLKGVDGVVFVADSQEAVLAANRESWANLKKNLALQGLFLHQLPHVLQYNKRDLPNILSVEELDSQLNEFNAPFFEAVATEGIGVEETLQAIVRLVIRSLRDRFNLSFEAAPSRVSPPPPRTEELITKPVEVKPQPLPRQEEGDLGILRPFPLPPPEVTPPTLPLAAEDVPFAQEEPPSAPAEEIPQPPAELELPPAPPEVMPAPEPPPVPEVAPTPEAVAPFSFAEPFSPESPREAQAPDLDLAPLFPEPPERPQAAEPPSLQPSPPALGEPFPVPSPVEEVPFLALEEPAPLASAGEESLPWAESPTPLEMLSVGQPSGLEEGQEAFTPQEPMAREEEREEGQESQAAPAFSELQEPPAVGFPASEEPGKAMEEVASPEPVGLGDPFDLPPLEASAEEDVFALVPAPAREPIPAAAAVERVIPKAVARHGELRELEVEVPVPAAWVGGRRVTLQLRLTLVPEEKSHEP